MQHAANPWPNNYVPTNVAASGIFNSGPEERTPVSTAMYGTTSTFSWAHTVPSLMPWSARGGDVVHFTAPFLPPDPCTSRTATSWELLNQLGPNHTNAHLHLKRRSDQPDALPQKVCVTEERMAARFKELHITNQYSLPAPSQASAPPPFPDVDKSITNIKDLDGLLKCSESGSCSPSKSLILAPEIKKLVEPEKIFASTFLTKVERPSMALVVWQPQGSVPQRNEASDENQDQTPVHPPATFLHHQHMPCVSDLVSDLQPKPQEDEEMDA